MDKRLIFRYRSRTSKSSRGAGPGRPSVALELRRLSVQGTGGPSGPAEVRGAGDSNLPGFGDWVEPGLREKPRGGSRERPYRRPTQVAGYESTKVDG
jgi:hypothetical protein